MDDFLAKERALRQKTAALAASTGHVATMRSHGTRKRRRKGKEDKDKRKRRKHGEEDDRSDDDEASREDQPAEKKQDESDSEESEQDVFGSPKRAASESTPDTSPAAEDAAAHDPKPKPRPRPRVRVSRSSPGTDAPSPGVAHATGSPATISRHPSQALSDDELSPVTAFRGAGKKKPARLVFSDEDE